MPETPDLFAGSQTEATIARLAAGNWNAFPKTSIPEVYRAAEPWAAALRGVERPWLCWCVSDPWCRLQQRLVHHIGWTPVVGHDTNIHVPTVLPGSVYVDFNADLRLPRLLMYFVLEWIFLFAERLAFWHVDFLLSYADMLRAARCFEALEQGQMALPWCRAHWLLRTLAPYRAITNANRLFEVVGCVTREASRSQWQEGLGFWRNAQDHPNNVSLPRTYDQWEHTVGVTHWARKHADRHVVPPVDIKTGHAATWKYRGLGRTTAKQTLLEQYTDLGWYARRLGIEDLLEGAAA
jgi:hypothetical protein